MLPRLLVLYKTSCPGLSRRMKAGCVRFTDPLVIQDVAAGLGKEHGLEQVSHKVL